MAAYDITALGTALEFDTTFADGIASVKIPSKDWVALVWQQSSSLMYVQVFSINTSTGALAAIGSPLDLETGTATTTIGMSVEAIDSSNLVVARCGDANDGFVQLISLDGSGNCSTNGTPVEFDTGNGSHPKLLLLDSTHFILCWTSTSTCLARCFSFSTGAGTITGIGTALAIGTSDGASVVGNFIALSSSKILVTYRGVSSDGFAIVLSLDGSYNVTAAGAELEFLDVSTIRMTCPVLISNGSPMVVSIAYQDTTGDDSSIRTYQINTSTWAITAYGAVYKMADTTGLITTGPGRFSLLLDSTHIISWMPGVADDGFVFITAYDSGTGTITATSSLELSTADVCWNALAFIQTGLFVAAWQDTATGDGFMQAFRVDMGGVSSNTTNFFMFLDRR